MGAEYTPAPEIQEIAGSLVLDHHGHLKEAVIEYLWREGAWSSKGRIILGTSILASGREKYYLDGADFVMIINATAWITLDPAQRRAVVDHQLYHMEKDGDGERDGAPKWTIAPHDIEEFGGVVDRHGLYLNDVRKFVEVAMQKSESFQARLDLGAAEVAATTEPDPAANLGPAPVPGPDAGAQAGEAWVPYAAPDHGTPKVEEQDELPVQ